MEDRDAAATPSHVFGEPAWQLTLGKLELADPASSQRGEAKDTSRALPLGQDRRVRRQEAHASPDALSQVED